LRGETATDKRHTGPSYSPPSSFPPSPSYLKLVDLHRVPRQLEAPDVLALCDEDVHAAGEEGGREGERERGGGQIMVGKGRKT